MQGPPKSKVEFARKRKQILLLLIAGALVATVVISPWNFDPVSLPKMSVVSMIAILGLVLHLRLHRHKSNEVKQKRDSLEALLLVLTFLLSLNLLINNYSFSERLFGIGSRNTGFVTLSSFVAICFLASRYVLSLDTDLLLKSLAIANVLIGIYYLIQRVGIDPIPVTDFYVKPSSTLGNPNFVSGFLGMTGAIPILLYLHHRQSLYMIFASLSTFITLFVIYDSQSIQGFFVLGFCIAIMVLLISFRKSKTAAVILLLIFMIGVTISFAGLLGAGPLTYQPSSTTLLTRIDYWRAAISMTLDHPLLGVGLDGYWDHYRVYRDKVSFERFGESQVSDTPHNVFLDYFASGGLPLGLAFTLIIVLVYFKVLTKLLRSNHLDFMLFSLFTVFNGYLVQSFISPNQIGIGVWLWLLLGSLWANCKEEEEPTRDFQQSRNTNLSHEQSKFGLIIRRALSILLLALVPVVTSAIRTDAKFLEAAKSGDASKLISTSSDWPLDTKRLILVEGAFASDFNQLKLEIALVGVENNPNSYELWRAIFENPLAPAKLKSEALIELRRLEPRYDSLAR